MSKVIGIISWNTLRWGRLFDELNYNFVRGVEAAGGLPVLFPVLNDTEAIDAFLDYVDALLIIGGEDIAPFAYGEEPHQKLHAINIERDGAETKIIRGAYQKKLPLLAVCRGMQLANVVFGGSLYQDIYSQREGLLVHSPRDKGFEVNYHTIEIEKGTFLHELYGETTVVNSFHHQAIKDLGEGFCVVARSKDGIIEAVGRTDDWPYMGVQFHPEFMKHNDRFIEIFRRLVELA
ncbi:MAG: gamma-glutamyl-gamma-aminobutyrate hydrolase family protein [Tissierellia bacterium]|nr:gamma-glutamyl-gamma-aminobutyrate hydrolase family protein [Tissierellia bacterium]